MLTEAMDRGAICSSASTERRQVHAAHEGFVASLAGKEFVAV